MRVLRGVVYMTNSKGSMTQPCRTPLEDVCQEDRSVPHDTEATSRAAETSSIGKDMIPAVILLH